MMNKEWIGTHAAALDINRAIEDVIIGTDTDDLDRTTSSSSPSAAAWVSSTDV